MVVQERLYTAEDLWKLSADETKHYELIEGELVEMSPTGGEHGQVTAWLGSLIVVHVRTNKLGRVFAAETGFILALSPDTVLAPDIAFVSKERLQSVTDKFLPVAPDLVVEVISPSNTASEINEKALQFFKAGTRQMWVVYPKTRMIHVYYAINEIKVLGIEDMLDGGDILPGFKVLVREIFSVLDD